MPFKPEDVISASDISQWVYCHRAWHLARLGAENENQQALARGVRLHERHGRSIAASEALRRIALFLMLFAGVLLALALIAFLR